MGRDPDAVEQERLYALLSSFVWWSRQVGWDKGADPEQAGAGTRVRVQIPADAFDAAHFSPFVSSWSRLGVDEGVDLPRQHRLLRDMMELGVGPTLVSMVARGYAQHGSAEVVLRILDPMEEAERGGRPAQRPSQEGMGRGRRDDDRCGCGDVEGARGESSSKGSHPCPWESRS